MYKQKHANSPFLNYFFWNKVTAYENPRRSTMTHHFQHEKYITTRGQ